MASSTKKSEQMASGGMTLDELSQAFSSMLGREEKQPSTELDPIAPSNEAAQTSVADETSTTVAASAVNTQSIVEAVLFVGRPDNLAITSEQLVSLMRGVQAEEIDQTITDLNTRYEANGSPFSIVLDGDGYRLQLRREFGGLRDRFFGRIRAARLSPAAVEVLSLVAYHEPLSADEVARLRGMPSGHILSQLVRRQLLRLERSDEKPIKKKYFTTSRFLKLFHLRSLEDLPRSDDLQRQ
jgi:segregation and condensation protein B